LFVSWSAKPFSLQARLAPVRVVAVGARAKRSHQGSATGEHRMGNRGQDPRLKHARRALRARPSMMRIEYR
jgi:hypothetical protein